MDIYTQSAKDHAPVVVEHTFAWIGPFPRLSLTPGAIRHVSPALDQHNTNVYQSVLGVTADEIRQIREQGVV